MNPVEPNWPAIPMAEASIPKNVAAEVPAEVETLPDKPDAEPAIEELSPIEETAAQEDIVQTTPTAVQEVATPTEAETVPASEAKVATPEVEEVAPTTDAEEIPTGDAEVVAELGEAEA